MQDSTGDGCSGAVSFLWHRVSGKPPPFHGCCQVHDEAYQKGGTWRERLAADRDLGGCVVCSALREGYHFCAALLAALVIYLGVRAGGAKHAPPLHLLAKPAVWLGWAREAEDYRWGRVR